MNTPTQEELLHRAHPSQLALELYLHRANEEAELEALDRHIEHCEACRAQLDAMRDFDAGWPDALPADLDALLGGTSALTLEATQDASQPRPTRRPSPSPPAPEHTTSWRRAAKPLLLFAVASLALLALVGKPSSLFAPVDGTSTLPTDTTQPDIIRRKSANFRLDVFIHNGEQARLAIDGEQVYPGERVGFQISAAKAGYLLIAGRDEASNTYLGYPQDGEGEAMWMEVSREEQPIKLDQALLLDEVLGKEKLAAMYCNEPFSFEELEPILSHEEIQDQSIPRGCVIQIVTLHKIAPPQP